MQVKSWVKSGRFHGWNPPDFRVKSPTLHSSNWRVFAKTLAFIILGGFHRSNLGEICQISWVKSTRFQGEIPHPAFIKLKSFCWNTCFYNFGWISQVKSGWNPPDFMDEIHQISGWSPLDFKGEIPHPAFIKLKSFCWNTCFYNFGWISQVKSGWNLHWISQDEIHQISGWNPLDFMKSLVIIPTLHSSNWRVFAETLAFIIWVDFTGEICQISWVKSGGFHEILGHSPHPAFIKLKSFCWNTCFYNFGWISQVKSGWNPLDFTGEIHQISRVKSPTLLSTNWRVFAETLAFIILGGFHRWYLGEICRISPEICHISQISWNPLDFTWNLLDFTDFMKSTGFHGEICQISWNLYEICQMSWNLLDFMKSARFHGMWAFVWWSSIGLSF